MTIANIAPIVGHEWTEVLTMYETIQTITNIVCIVFCVYGTIVFSRWHHVAEKTDIAIDELREELKEGADHADD